MNVEIIGYIGGSITSSSMVVQVIKSFQKRSVADFSWIMLMLNASGCSLIIIYAFLIQKPAIYCTVLVSISCIFTIFGMKLYFECYKKMNLPNQNPVSSLSNLPV